MTRVDLLRRLQRGPGPSARRWVRKRGLLTRGRSTPRRGRGDRTLTRPAEQQDPPGGGRAGLPIGTILIPGQAGDNPQLLPLLEGIKVRRRGGGRPRSRPEEVRTDKAY